MAISSTAVWEVRANAGNSGLQGGFYKPTAGSTDYSQQDTAQLSLTDIATDGAGTGLSSATGGFTAAMVGNGIYITGGATTAGWYEITAYTSSNAITIDRSCGLSKTGVTGRVGGATTWIDASLSSTVAGNKVWIKNDGTHTQVTIVTPSAGGEAAQIYFEGYNTSRGDNPQGTNRPTINCAANYIALANYSSIKNCIFTGTGVFVLEIGYAGNCENCKITNTSATADRDAGQCGSTGGSFIDCEFISDNGNGIELTGNGATIFGCYIHDCAICGIESQSGGGYYHILFTIIDTVAIGIGGSSGVKGTICNCVFYNCSTAGIQTTTTADNMMVFNSIFDTCAIGMDIAANHAGEMYEDYNNFYNCTTDRVNINAGPHSIDADPKFTDAANGDFSLQSSSTMIDTAFAIRLGVG